MNVKASDTKALLLWLTIIGGTIAILATIVGGSISYGQHLTADVAQDKIIEELKHDLKEVVKEFDARLDMLEKSHDHYRPDDVSLFVNHLHAEESQR